MINYLGQTLIFFLIFDETLTTINYIKKKNTQERIISVIVYNK